MRIHTLAEWFILPPAALFMALFQSCGYYSGPVSDHYNGRKFTNLHPDSHTLSETITWFWEMKTVDWPEWISDSLFPAPPRRVIGQSLHVTYINQSTVLIQTEGLNILTDPIWSDYAGPISWLGAKRIRKPGVNFDSLPPVDVVLLSHDHFDHLDIPTLKRIIKRDNPSVLCGLGVARRLSSLKSRKIIELDWWQFNQVENNNVTIHFVPVHHRSGRGLFDSDKTLWGGYIVHAGCGNILFIGDSAYDTLFSGICSRFSPFRLTILSVGSYEKRWFMRNQHMNPAEAVSLHKQMLSRQSIGIHFGTFKEHPEQAVDAHEADLYAALDSLNIPRDRFLLLRFGEGREF